ncbi:MAG: hypothetical protein AAFX06_04335 [Planctomycetota bacterium]
MDANVKPILDRIDSTLGVLHQQTQEGLETIRIELEGPWLIETRGQIVGSKSRTPAAARKAAEKRFRQLKKEGYHSEHPALGVLLPRFVSLPGTNHLVRVEMECDEDVDAEMLDSLAMVATWTSDVREEFEASAFGHYLEKVEAIAPDPSWFPVIKRPSDIWKHCTVEHIRPYRDKTVVIYATCTWEEDGLEWCFKDAGLQSLCNAAFWPVTQDGSGYLSESLRKATRDAIALIGERKKLIRGWK